jgi:proline racemase
MNQTGHHFKHANVYADTICVSPATSVSAKLAALVAKGALKVGDDCRKFGASGSDNDRPGDE